MVAGQLTRSILIGKHSFFKAHKDTPRGENMFGSLVVVFPSKHIGGALLLRHEGEEWSFDAAKELSQCTDPSESVGFVAFYSDVEHEVAVVESGYRITLTYNLYYASDPTPQKSFGIRQDASLPGEAEFKVAFQKLLNDTAVLPEGGLLGFGLQHEYPVNERTRVSDLLCNLKGSDAVVRRVCEQLSLAAELKFIYKDDDGGPSMLSSRFIDLSRSCEVEDLKDELRGRGGITICDQTPGHIEDMEYDGDVAVYWLNELTDTTCMKGMFVAHGNEASLEHYYASICLIVKVGHPGENRVLNVNG